MSTKKKTEEKITDRDREKEKLTLRYGHLSRPFSRQIFLSTLTQTPAPIITQNINKKYKNNNLKFESPNAG